MKICDIIDILCELMLYTSVETSLVEMKLKTWAYYYYYYHWSLCVHQVVHERVDSVLLVVAYAAHGLLPHSALVGVTRSLVVMRIGHQTWGVESFN